MIELLTLFLGLTTGVQPVEVLAAPEVARVEVRLDGAPVAELGAEELAEYGLARVDFGSALAPHRLELTAFGVDGRSLGWLRHEVNLTPDLAATVAPAGERTPVMVAAEDAGRPLAAAGRPLATLAEEGGDGGDLVVVMAPGAGPCLADLEERVIARIRYDPVPSPVFPAGVAGAVVPMEPGSTGVRLYFLDPSPTAPLDPGEPDPFVLSPPKLVLAGQLPIELIRYRAPFPDDPVDLPAAVAAAGRHAWGGGRPRAVLLLLGPQGGAPRSAGDGAEEPISAAQARAFLERLRVPLQVWRCGHGGDDGPWAVDRRVGNVRALLYASDRLRRSLGRQRVVWVEGRFLPGEVKVSEDGG